MPPEQEIAFLEPFIKQAISCEILEVSHIIKAYSAALDNKKISKSTVYDMLHRNGWRKLMPRSQHPNKADDEAIAAYKKMSGRLNQFINFYTNTETSFRSMFQDEAGFGRINKPKCCWCADGVPPVVTCQRIR